MCKSIHVKQKLR